ncbi:hypothetical protein K443DRAFT_11795 [Laccaria amethystina LaAM-08-1]|uniref:Unplaced genomic scaffold K443scaffold_241, whole genome shotgun sequence n=1 Tax=Laccaria amethystina LaAM-08-1 TaxID=1095629 RepID=A0A0C9XFD4_9AGAR|nr:hypothetical protein K443DRAFT_11795 [Laccaria amethystina LaAM-08-1]
MLQQATQIDHSHPDSASSELILTGLDFQAGEHSEISVALVEKQDVTGNMLYVLDKFPLPLDDFAALLDFMKDILCGQYTYKNIPFKTLAPMLRAGTTLTCTSITSIAARSFYLWWNPSWDTMTLDLERDLTSPKVPFASLPPNTVVDLIDSTILVRSIGSSDVTARPESRRPAQAEPCEAKLYEAPIGLPVAHGSGFTFLKPQAVAQATAWVAVF